MSSVKNFGAAGDGKTDDTQAIRHAIKEGDGWIRFPRGPYRITETIELSLIENGVLGLHGSDGMAEIIMAGSGPAFRVVGNHKGTADPSGITPHVFQSERMPLIRDLAIQGAHPEADGIELTGTMQARIEGVMARKLRHGIRLVKRNRNVLINHCQIYHNTGVGIFIDGVNLHQINIGDNHISYNRLGGIRIERSEVRNLQITGNDIEYNNAKSHKGFDPEPTAEIYVDTTAEGATVNEITIASNTIQATVSPGGANIRILDKPGQNRQPGLWAISGNIIGSQENNVHLTGCHGIVLSGNFIYSCGNRNLLIENSSQINLGSNSFRRHTPSMHTGIRIVDSQDCVITGCTVQDHTEEGQPTGASLLELSNCERINVTGCQFLDGVPYGIDIDKSRAINIACCTVQETRTVKKAKGSIRFSGQGTGNKLHGNSVQPEPAGL